MPQYLELACPLKKRFPGLAAQVIRFRNVRIERENKELELYKKEIIKEILEKWKLEDLKDHHIFRAYRNFFWKLDIDPTKTRPAAEAIIRRVLRGKELPRINTWVDSYNLASMKTAIPIASFDSDILEEDLIMRESVEGEIFLGIGMDQPIVLNGGEIVIDDGKRLAAVYPYRDADYSKITLNTSNVLMLMCGAPCISMVELEEASQISKAIVSRFCDGDIT
jgi:DNA/RNA-binding domain of Phe-tRNA-synthetase-like protein